MKISRWIYFPLVYTILYVSFMIFAFWFFEIEFDSFLVWIWLINSLLIGFLLLYYSYRKAKKLSNESSDERIHHVKQERQLVVLLGHEKAFELCREAILSLRKGKITSENPQDGEIKASCRLSWDVPRHKIEMRLKKISDNLTEIELQVLPPWKTVMVSSGYSWRAAEDICNYLKEKDAEINRKVLTDSAAILEDVYVNPFRKANVEK